MDKTSDLGVHAIMTAADLQIMEEDQHTVNSTIETVIVVMTVTVEGHMNVGAIETPDGQMMLGGEKEKRRGDLGEMWRREGTEEQRRYWSSETRVSAENRMAVMRDSISVPRGMEGVDAPPDEDDEAVAEVVVVEEEEAAVVVEEDVVAEEEEEDAVAAAEEVLVAAAVAAVADVPERPEERAGGGRGMRGLAFGSGRREVGGAVVVPSGLGG